MNLRNIPFQFESYVVKTFYGALGRRPSSRPYVSGDSFRALADHIMEKGRTMDPGLVDRGDIVFVQAWELPEFIESILPLIDEPFVLITHNGDIAIDERYAGLADHPLLIRWFAQNALLKHPKVMAVPIGLENRNLHWNGVVSDFRRLARSSGRRRNRILYAFTIGTNSLEREAAMAALASSPLADHLDRVNSRLYRKILRGYRFVASPPGNGVDCHRTWEAIYLGVIPIVKRSAFYDAFPDLPVLAVDGWSEILGWDDEYLETAYRDLSASFPNCRDIHMPYWEGLIESARKFEIAEAEKAGADASPTGAALNERGLPR